MAAPPKWQDITVSSKILGHISAGVYRSAGGALKELVSNAFDAKASRVDITTNWPSFDVFTCHDNGVGFTETQFREIMTGGIGDSKKRVNDNDVANTERPVIGKLGIGMLGIAQVCHRFDVVSHHRDTQTGFVASVTLADYLREHVDETEPDKHQPIDVGKFTIEKIPYDQEQAGTRIIAVDMRSAFVRSFRKRHGEALPQKFEAFLETIRAARPSDPLGNYWQMVMELCIASPVPYAKDAPFEWEHIVAEEKTIQRVDIIKARLESYRFDVVVDGMLLRKPNYFPYPSVRQGTATKGRLYPIDLDTTVYGRQLRLTGYVYLQDGLAIEPRDLRGILIRIRNVAIGGYDPTFLAYPKIEGPRFTWVSGEIFVESGLEDALNIDRDSFNQMHPHYVKLQDYVHSLLGDVFSIASSGVGERSAAKKQAEHDSLTEALSQVVARDLHSGFELVKSTAKTAMPVEVDIERKVVVISPLNNFTPRSRAKRDLLQMIGVAFEVAMQLPVSQRRQRFYELVSELLDK